MFERLLAYDKEITRYIYFHRPSFAEEYLAWITKNSTSVSILFVVSLIILYFVKNRHKYLYIALNILLIIGASALVSNSLKMLTKRLRPYKILEGVVFTNGVQSGGYSFPSGHATETFALMTAIFLLMRNSPLRWIALLWALLIAYTRIAFGLHFPLDIIGGIILGSGISYLWLRWNPLKKWFKKLELSG